MLHFRFSRAVTMATIVTVCFLTAGLAACGKSSSGGGTNKHLILASELPTTGTDAGNGLPTQEGVQLAVQQASLPNGYTLSFEPKNDVSTTSGSHDPQTGATNITALAADSSVMGVVGPFNSSVAVAEIPIANRASLTLISPANTNPALTLSQYATANNVNFAQLHPANLPDCYFRLPGNDVVQGTLDADIAYAAVASPPKPSYTSVYVVDDNETYGVGLANFFTTEFQAKGGTVLGRASITQNQASALTALATTIKATHPQFVFYGGVTSTGGGTLKADLGAGTIMEGGDGIADDPSWLTTAGSAAVQTFGTVAAPDASTFTAGAAATFVSQFTTAFSSGPINYSASAYDAANIIIAAIKTVITSGKVPTRANVCAQVALTQYTGVTGGISFNQFGDNAGAKVFSVYEVAADGKWHFIQEVPVSG